jgi:hypothetical protein
MATEGGSHGGASQPEMESTLVNRTTDNSFVGQHYANLGSPAVQQGYSLDLWVPEGGWDYDEDEASIDPFPLQLQAAHECFVRFFVDGLAWVHLAAEMQAGKTGVMAALIRLVLRNQQRLRFRASRIFTITGMSENSWREQTKKRLPRQLRENVYHNSSLSQLNEKLKQIHVRENGLRNILILVDESHIASGKENRPDKLVYTTIRSFVPAEEWAARNIRFLTISATDPAKVMSLDKNQDAVVVLKTTNEYQSVEALQAQGRIHATESLGDLPSATALAELKTRVATYGTPCYHIVRPKQGKVEECLVALEREFPGTVVRRWDSETLAKEKTNRNGTTVTSSEPDINTEVLDNQPLAHTFIVLKDMFRAAKTMNDRYVGVVWDRLTGKDDTTLQGLLGRVCGYGKNPNTHIYCSGESVDNYLRIWHRLCSNHRSERMIEGVEVRAAMTGVDVKPMQGGNTCVYTSPTQSMPIVRDPAWEPPATTQSTCELSPVSFANVKEAKEWALEHTPHTGATAYGLYAADGKTRGKTHIIYRGEPREIKSETETRNSSDLSGGLSAAYARVMPVLNGETIRYIVIYRP